MMLALVHYLKKVKLASLPQIAQHVQQKPALIESMLTVLVQQNRVLCNNSAVTCGKSCSSCLMRRSAPIYCWNHRHTEK